MDIPQFVGLLVVILGTAKALGALAQRIGQPAVLVDPQTDVLHLLAELGVIILLFAIGLETNLRQLLQVGGATTVVALVEVALPFALGYAVCMMLGFETLVAVVAGATLTAPSVGITARVLADLNRLQEPESHIILGAAVIDDVIGLVILAVVTGLTAGQPLTVLGVAHLGHFFVPLFFVTVGAAVDISVLNPLDPGNRSTLLIGGLLILAAVIGKFLAGYAPVWFKGNKNVIGVGI